jgi:rod shape-determining protein MreD
MFNKISVNLFRFVMLTAVQVLVLDNIHLHGLFNPYIYMLFILMLPLETPAWLVLILGFFSGWVIDSYAHSGGVHASATVLTAFLRPFILRLLKPAAGYQPEDRPSVSSLGFLWFFTYCSVLIFIHHLWLFIVESFSFTQLIFVFQKIAVSSMVSIVIVLSLQYLFYRRKERALV